MTSSTASMMGSFGIASLPFTARSWGWFAQPETRCLGVWTTGHELDDILAEALAGLIIDRTDVGDPRRGGGVGIVGHHVGLLTGLINLRGLGLWRDDADRDPVVSLTDEVFEEAILLFDLAVLGLFDIDLDAGLFLILGDTGLGDVPEGADVVGDEGNFKRRARGGLVGHAL